ncbi:lymphotoxin-alpha isoform X2 [Siphateles boraxobius]
MTGSNNPRFRLLVGWCCLMSSALLIMTVFLSTNLHKKSETNKTGNEKPNSTGSTNSTGDGKSDQQKGSRNGLSFNDYIHLIRDKNETWICDSCESSSLSLNNNTVEIKTNGFYYIHAQVIFDKAIPETKKEQARVVLLKNKGPATQVRILSEVIRFEPGTLTLIRLVRLKNGESISLNIQPESLRLSIEACHTYWEILLYKK